MSNPSTATKAKAIGISLLRACIHGIREAVSPSRCAACDALLSGYSAFCPACASTILPEPDPFPSGANGISVAAYGQFGGALATAIRRFKYENRPDLSDPLGQLLRRAARDAALWADAVIPVPLHARRLCERGYNQAALLARPVARELSAPLFARALVRLRATGQQAQLERDERLQNVRSAFALRTPVRGKRIVLVDDVVTTGATLLGCAGVLLSAGAESVTGLVLARA